jgi:hypothetical protein
MGADAGLSASVSIVQTKSPMASVSPSFAMCLTTPACSALISKVAFSLSSSAITSSRSAHSPSLLSHFTSVTSLILSPTVGTFISIAIYFILCEQISFKNRILKIFILFMKARNRCRLKENKKPRQITGHYW